MKLNKIIQVCYQKVEISCSFDVNTYSRLHSDRYAARRNRMLAILRLYSLCINAFLNVTRKFPGRSTPGAVLNSYTGDTRLSCIAQT